MKLKTLKDINLNGKTILYRAPYDIDVLGVDGVLKLADDMRIEATLPTLEYLLKENCKIVILTYVGRPDGQVVEQLRTNLHAKKLSDYAKENIGFSIMIKHPKIYTVHISVPKDDKSSARQSTNNSVAIKSGRSCDIERTSTRFPKVIKQPSLNLGADSK